MKSLLKMAAGALIIFLAVGIYLYLRRPGTAGRNIKVLQFLNNPQEHQDWVVKSGTRCAGAPFLFPTTGYTGFLWDDSFRPGHRHQGIDIFSGTEAGVAPVYAAYNGYLTRLPDWKSTVIIRTPEDPLQAGRQIWVYYTHMAGAQGNSFISEAFPPGSEEVFVEAGTFLGMQGNFSGNPGKPVGVHLHFSIVLDDGEGHFRNELDIGNTLDPSPYLGFALNARQKATKTPGCDQVN